MSLMMSSELAITPNQDKEVKDPDGNSYTNNIHDPHHFLTIFINGSRFKTGFCPPRATW